jgi:hypothetical protein
MQRTLVIISAVALAAMGASFAACNSDDSNATPGVDSGSGDSNVPVADSNVPVVDSNVPTPDSEAQDSNTPPSDDASVDAGADAKSPVDASDAGPGVDASDAEVAVDASDASSAGDANGAGEDASDAGVTLNVMNFENWCSISINGSVSAPGTVVKAVLAAGSKATIVAMPKPLADGGSNFIIGADPWFGTDENDGGAAPGVDNDSGVNETSTVQVTIGAGPTQCVQVCCQFPNNTPVPCPTTNLCPL